MNPQHYYDAQGVPASEKPDNRRFSQIRKHIEPVGTLLDVGCGLGDWLLYLVKHTQLEVVGADVSSVRLAHTKKRMEGKNVRLEVADVRHLPYPDNSFDMVTAFSVVEHVPDYEKALAECIRVAKKRVVITVPYKEYIKKASCPECGTAAPLFGHLHRFDERSFDSLDQKVSIEPMQNMHSVSHYLQKAGREFFSHRPQETSNLSDTYCPSCYSPVPYRKRIERSLDRFRRMITGMPESLLVRVDC